MSYLDLARLAEIDARSFRERPPYPWIEAEGLLTQKGYQRLLATLPDLALFESSFGAARAHGQRSHDRYALEYHEGLGVAREWHDFVAELHGPEYLGFLRRMLGPGGIRLSFHWHYTPTGCSISPHCDAKRKRGSHIFYLNTEENWDPTWGGQTLILDDGGCLERHSAPDFEAFQAEIAAEAIGNRSLLFARTEHSWHGMRALRCPSGSLRKVFIVVVNRFGPKERIRSLFGAAPAGY